MTIVRRVLLVIALALGALILTPTTCATAPAYASEVKDAPVVLDVVNNIQERFVIYIAKRGYAGVRIGEVSALGKQRFRIKSGVWPAYTEIWIIALAKGDARTTSVLQVMPGSLVTLNLYPNTPSIIEYAEHTN